MHVLRAVLRNVDVVNGHAPLIQLVGAAVDEDTRLVHVVPGAVQIGLAVEVLGLVKTAPVGLGILIQVIYPD